MKKVDQLLKLAELFEKKAQVADAGSYISALKHAKLWNLSTQVSQLFGKSGAPGGAVANISIIVNPGGLVDFEVAMSPNLPDEVNRFREFLKGQIGHHMEPVVKQIPTSEPTKFFWMKVQELKQ